MIEVPMTDDIRKFETNIVGPFTLRQVVCVAVAALVAIPVFIFWEGEVTDKIFPAMIAAGPILAFGWIKMDGCPAEMILMRYLFTKFLAPPMRKALTESEYHKEFVKLKKEEQKKKNGGKEVKEVIRYSNKKKNRIYT